MVSGHVSAEDIPRAYLTNCQAYEPRKGNIDSMQRSEMPSLVRVFHCGQDALFAAWQVSHCRRGKGLSKP